MVYLRYTFYGFFLVFNVIYLAYNVFTGFNWASALFPFLIALYCAWNVRRLIKESRQSK